MVDVGTDHAMLPVWLVQTGRSPWTIGTDIRPGPLQRAAALVDKMGVSDRVRLMLTDGLVGIEPLRRAVVTVAGMGGETIVSILSAAPWIVSGPLLVLSPQSKQAELRRWLTGHGFEITSERLVKDSGRIYPVFTARGGVAREYTPAEFRLGLLDQVAGDPLFAEYLDCVCRQCAKAAPFDSTAAALTADYAEIRRALEK